ncbi:hypothetical protein LTR04_004999 [Oleoguttula sp. CCFEE 6159]|nr:hypothetical protein LTR04_004999 [Oleoguttula sp. CCFEE 6159]
MSLALEEEPQADDLVNAAQVETLLHTQEPSTQSQNGTSSAQVDFFPPATSQAGLAMVPEGLEASVGGGNMDQTLNTQMTPESFGDTSLQGVYPALANGNSMAIPIEEPYPWEMIGLGLEESLPNQDVINELNQIYFQKVHCSVPMIHQPRYLAAMNLAPHMRPPICLRYVMWCLAAAVTDKYEGLQEHFYQRARKYAQMDELKGHGESMITIGHCQAWVLLATYEFKLMYFPRAWMSTGRAVRLAQMMGLHRLDGVGLDVKQCLPPPRDWTEREERRRTFWMCFCEDRYASIGTGWPMSIEEKDILTDLPSTEEAFNKSKPGRTMSLAQALDPSGAPSLSPFAGVVLMACLFGRNLTHLHRPGPDDNDHDLNGDFWKRHRAMDNILSSTALALPDHLRLPHGVSDPNIVFLNMNIHTSTICLHQAAIFKADRNRLPSRISADSKIRCITAASEIQSIMRTIGHQDLAAMNPFISFCLYVAARVFVQYMKLRPKDEQIKAQLHFLLSAMHALKRKNPLTESFLVQLDVDLEGAGMEDIRGQRSYFQSPNETLRKSGCSAINQRLGRKGGPSTFGTHGVASYTSPNQDGVTQQVSNYHKSDPTYSTVSKPTLTSYSFVPRQNSPVNMPCRQKTPQQNVYPSPVDLTGEMDISPDDGRGQPTPSTSNSQRGSSSHTSTTCTSPGQREQVPEYPQGPCPNSTRPPDNTTNGVFFTNEEEFFGITDLSYPLDTGEPESGFALPPDWGMGGTGMTPASSSAGMMPLADADWNNMDNMDSMSNMLDGYPGWEAVGPDHNVDSLGRRLN